MIHDEEKIRRLKRIFGPLVTDNIQNAAIQDAKKQFMEAGPHSDREEILEERLRRLLGDEYTDSLIEREYNRACSFIQTSDHTPEEIDHWGDLLLTSPTIWLGVRKFFMETCCEEENPGVEAYIAFQDFLDRMPEFREGWERTNDYDEFFAKKMILETTVT